MWNFLFSNETLPTFSWNFYLIESIPYNSTKKFFASHLFDNELLRLVESIFDMLCPKLVRVTSVECVRWISHKGLVAESCGWNHMVKLSLEKYTLNFGFSPTKVVWGKAYSLMTRVKIRGLAFILRGRLDRRYYSFMSMDIKCLEFKCSSFKCLG